jgi:hypothetical protein
MVEFYSDALRHPVIEEFFSEHPVKVTTQKLWCQVYGDVGWIKQELLKAILWCDANPQRKPKANFSRFFTTWLATGWEKHRKTFPSNKVTRQFVI